MKRSSVCVATAVAALTGVTAQAGSVSFLYNQEISGGDTPGGISPWLSLTFDDEGTAGSVVVTFGGINNLIDDEFVTELLFNVTPSADASLLTVSNIQKTGLFTSDFSFADNAFNGVGGSNFDAKVIFGQSNRRHGAERFGAGESLSFELTGLASLEAVDFNVTALSSKGNLLSQVHVQGIDGPIGSGKIAPTEQPNPVTSIPSPSAAGLGAIALAGLISRRRRRSA